MSRSLLLLALLLTTASLAGPAALAQVCTGEITLSSQAAVNAFNCTEVTGYLRISGGDITDLTPLSGLTSVAFLYIEDNDALTSLVGLEGLTSVVILSIIANPVLASLGAMEGITSLEWLTIEGNPALMSLAGLESLVSIDDYLGIVSNPSLASIEGLEALTSVGVIRIVANIVLASLTGLAGLTSVEGDLAIHNNLALSDCACGLAGLISGDPPAFTGVSGDVLILRNASGGQCFSPQVVLDAFVAAMCMPVANEPAPGVPDRFALSPPYPNPFRGTATIAFAVPAAADVRLVVYDVLGREVAVLLDGAFEASRHEVVFDAVGLPNGTYLVRMTAGGGFAQTQRVTLMK